LTFQDILQARRTIQKYLPPTPFLHSPLLSRLIEAEVYLKHENLTLIGSFKARGALACLSRLDESGKSKGVITASTGNHGQGLALAGRLLNIEVLVYVPERCNPGKVAMIEALGASVVSIGRDLDDCREAAKKHAEEKSKLFVEDGNETSICAGTATIALEILERQPEIDTILVPVGNGALISGIGFAAKNLQPKIKVIGVQPEGAPCMYLSWKEGCPLETDKAETFADGISTRVPTQFSLQMMKESVDEMLLVSEDELEQAVYLLLQKTHTLVEGAAGASLAGALKMGTALRNRRVALVLTGANLEAGKLIEILSKHGGNPSSDDVFSNQPAED
jgi:threonine dehydratase